MLVWGAFIGIGGDELEVKEEGLRRLPEVDCTGEDDG